MTKTYSLLKKASYAVIALALAIIPVLQSTQASAAQLTARKVTIGSSLPSASTTYKFDFTIPTAASIGSIKFEFCEAASGTCNSSAATTGVVTSATLTAQTGTGATGFTLGANTANSSYITRTAAAISAGTPVSYTLSNVTNPSNSSATVFFVRISTYTGTNGSTGLTDSGTVATSTAGQVTVNASVDETLSFSLAATTVSLGTITTAAASTGTSTMSASTNAGSGYTITYSSPNSLQPTGGGTPLPSYSSASSQPGVAAGFGINLVDNATPNVGTNPTGGSGTASSGYASADTFNFVGGSVPTQVASATGPTNSTTYVVSYVANIVALTAPGAYTTNFTYVATPNF